MASPTYYTYNAGAHCPDCATAAGMTADGATDSEGNMPGVAYAWDETPAHGVTCDTCGDVIADPWKETAAEWDARMRALARDRYQTTEIEIDDDAEISDTGAGCWVAAWVWIDAEDAA
jgi:hypothetical protein